MSQCRKRERDGFAAVIAVLLLATTAVSVIASGRHAVDGADISRLALESARARIGARAGEALALSADRGGVDTADIQVDPALPVITFEETSDLGTTQWVVRAASGDARATRVYIP